MADRDTIIEAMARAIATALRATPEDYYWVDYTDEANAAYDAALPLIHNASLEKMAKFFGDTPGSQWNGSEVAAEIQAFKEDSYD